MSHAPTTSAAPQARAVHDHSAGAPAANISAPAKTWTIPAPSGKAKSRGRSCAPVSLIGMRPFSRHVENPGVASGNPARMFLGDPVPPLNANHGRLRKLLPALSQSSLFVHRTG